MALTVEDRINLACKIRDVQFKQEECFNKVLESLGAQVSVCSVQDTLEDELRELFVGILGLSDVAESCNELNEYMIKAFRDRKVSTDELLQNLDDFIR